MSRLWAIYRTIYASSRRNVTRVPTFVSYLSVQILVSSDESLSLRRRDEIRIQNLLSTCHRVETDGFSCTWTHRVHRNSKYPPHNHPQRFPANRSPSRLPVGEMRMFPALLFFGWFESPCSTCTCCYIRVFDFRVLIFEWYDYVRITEITNLSIERFREQDITGLKISMKYLVLV